MATDPNLHKSLTGNGWAAHKNDTYTKNGSTIHTDDSHYKKDRDPWKQHKNGNNTGR